MIIEYLLISLGGGVLLDLLLGDPPNRYHPVAWLGIVIEFFVPRLKEDNYESSRKETANGTVFACLLVVISGTLLQYAMVLSIHFLGIIVFIVFGALIVKVTISIRGMEKHALEIVEALQKCDLQHARHRLSLIVRRDTKDLDEQHLLSGIIECVGESIVDGILSPLFYYSLLGPFGAFTYRTINTLDSMVGYTDHYHKNIGWMSARLDTFANYIPARIAAVLIVISAMIFGADWKNSIQILLRDRNKTSSCNAGYPMATMAGALRIKLEKVGCYTLGDGYDVISFEKCRTSLHIMKLATLLFCVLFVVPLMLVLSYLGWWNLLFDS
jgi:adenosylcobinamide-phosphate synthase